MFKAIFVCPMDDGEFAVCSVTEGESTALIVESVPNRYRAKELAQELALAEDANATLGVPPFRLPPQLSDAGVLFPRPDVALAWAVRT
jgi:hypothetical protein